MSDERISAAVPALFDPSIARQWNQTVHALILTEHWGHTIVEACLWRCPFGDNDGGRAFGILQQHPGFFRQFYLTSGGTAIAPFLASVDDIWTIAQIKAAATFLTLHESMGIALLVQAYNQGIDAIDHGVRAPVYLDRFYQSLNSVRGRKG